MYTRFFDYFFYCPKFLKWNFIKNPCIEFSIKHCTTLIFLKKLDFCDFFKSFYGCFFIFYGTYFLFLLSKVSKIKFHKKSLIYPKIQYCTDIYFPRKIGFLRFFLRKFLLTVFYICYGTYYFFYCPKFQKWNFIKNPWYTTIQYCTTLIFLKKLDFCDFF